MRARSRRRARSSSSPASRAWTPTATSPRSAAAARTPRAWRSPRRSRPTSARSTPTSTASTRPIRASCPRRGGSTRVTFEEMLEMASLGSKVLQIRSVEFAGKYKVKLRVLSSFEDPEVDAARHAHHVRGRRQHGTGDHLRHRVQPRRGQDLGHGRRGPAGHRLRDPRADRRGQHRRRHDRAEHRRVGPHRLLVHRQSQRVPEGARRAGARARQGVQGARDHRRQPHLQGVGRRHRHALARRPRERRCSRRWPTRASTSR